MSADEAGRSQDRPAASPEVSVSFEITARVVYVWQWWCEPADRWEDYPPIWPSEQWARVHHPSAYNHVPEDHVLRLVRRTICDVEVPQ